MSADHVGNYSLRAEKAGFNPSVVERVGLAAGENRRVELVLQAVQSKPQDKFSTAHPAAHKEKEIEFEDSPNFTVAGITDSTGAGGHGADTSLRTSESLARETVALKSGESKEAGPKDHGNAYDVALAYKARGELTRARDQARKILANENSADVHRLLGDIDEELNNPLDAVREYEQAARLDPSEQNEFGWGTELLLHRAVQPAVEVFSKGAAAHPDSARMLAGLGAALYASGSYDEAARRLCSAADLRPADSTAYIFLGKMQKAAPSPLPCAEPKLARFAHDQPGNALANYYYAVAVSRRPSGAENAAEPQLIESLLQKAVTIDPQFAEAYLELGILDSARSNFTQAMSAYKKATEANPQLAEAHYRLGRAYKQGGDEGKAQQEFDIYRRLEKTEAAEIERRRRELRQFMIVLKEQPAASQ